MILESGSYGFCDWGDTRFYEVETDDWVEGYDDVDLPFVNNGNDGMLHIMRNSQKSS